MTSNQPVTIGVITATHNRLPLLQRAVASLEAQTYRHWVLAIIDDSTNSDTENWFKGREPDERIVYHRNPGNKGVGYSRNRGLELLLPRADFITKLDDDDYLVQTSLERSAAAMTNYPADSWFMSRHVDAATRRSITVLGEERTTYDYWADIGAGDVVVGDRTFFIASDLIAETGARFPEDIPLGGEWRFYAELSRHAKIRFFEGGETRGEYLVDGLSSALGDDLDAQQRELWDRFDVGRSLQLPAAARVSTERNLTRAAFRLLVKHVRSGSLRQGLPILKKLPYRVALKSPEFYDGIYAVASELVQRRLASDRSSRAEQAALNIGRRLVRRLRKGARSP